MLIGKNLRRTTVGIGLSIGLLLVVPLRDSGAQNIVGIHERSSNQYSGNCVSCHSDVLAQESQDPSVPAAHQAMFPHAPGSPGSNKQCRFCHVSVDLTQATAQPGAKATGNLRRQVDVAMCTLCHGPYRGGPGRQLYQAGLSPSRPDGPRLYKLVCSGCHNPLQSSQVRGKDAENIREAIDENKGGMRKLQVLSPLEVAALATALAE